MYGMNNGLMFLRGNGTSFQNSDDVAADRQFELIRINSKQDSKKDVKTTKKDVRGARAGGAEHSSAGPRRRKF
jgi:hypothetical protein